MRYFPRALFARMFGGKQYDASIGDRIRSAKSVGEIDSLLHIGRSTKAVPGTRRKWQRIASRRIAELTE